MAGRKPSRTKTKRSGAVRKRSPGTPIRALAKQPAAAARVVQRRVFGVGRMFFSAALMTLAAAGIAILGPARLARQLSEPLQKARGLF